MQDAQDDVETQPVETPVDVSPDVSVFRARLLIGLIQGALLCILLRVHDTDAWPATLPFLHAALTGVALLIPLPLIVSVGHMPPRKLALWLVPIALLLAFIAAYAEWRWGAATSHNAKDFPSGFAVVLLLPLLFIVWSLIQAGEQDKRWPAAYASYFEAAWKLGIQHLFVAVFVGAFWLVIGLGVGLFMMLKISLLLELIRSDWFWLPATTLVMACGFHLTDVRPGIVNGIRNLLLTMLSWLLPLLAVLVAAFLATVPLAGFELLWKTRFATTLLLSACAVLVILINTAFQDGSEEKSTHALLQHAARLACVLLLPMALIAAYALSLRVDQYGWSPDRVCAATCICIALFYAVGYLWAVVEPLVRRDGQWLPRLASVNVYAALFVVLLGLATMTPVADPARLSVQSQLGMLASGQTPAERFDFKFLRFDAARYGTEALETLTSNSDPAISDKAKLTLALKNRWETPLLPQPMLAEQLLLRTPGKIWPQGFLDNAWATHKQKWQLPACLREQKRRCDAFVGNFSGFDDNEVLLVPQDYGATVLLSNRDGSWQVAGTFDTPAKCPKIRDDLAVGRFQRVPPLETDLLVGNIRLRAKPQQSESGKCN